MESLELVVCGKVVDRISASNKNTQELKLNSTLKAGDGQWFAVRARGGDYAMAHSAAIYLENDQGFSGCAEKVPELVEVMKQRLHSLNSAPIVVQRELEYWETTDLVDQYQKQLPQLRKRIEIALSRYDQLLLEYHAQ